MFSAAGEQRAVAAEAVLGGGGGARPHPLPLLDLLPPLRPQRHQPARAQATQVLQYRSSTFIFIWLSFCGKPIIQLSRLESVVRSCFFPVPLEIGMLVQSFIFYDISKGRP